MKTNNIQLSLFDDDKSEIKRITEGKIYFTNQIKIPSTIADKLKSYNLEEYVNDVENNGLESTWNYICQFVIDNKDDLPEFLNLSSADEKRFKISNICHELPDEFIRKMRVTGLISIRGAGRFVDVNKQELEKVKYVLKNYSEIKNFSSEKEYFDYVKTIDLTLVNLHKVLTQNEQESRQLFIKWVNQFELDTLRKELIIVSDTRSQSKHELLKFINEPLRLEFLTALILQKKFTNLIVKPNYSFDDEGMPTSFAPGNTADVVCVDSAGNILFEVTLMRGRQQVANEMIPIERHLKEIRNNDKNAFSVFLAPSIHQDAIQYAAFAKFQSGIDIITLDIPTFATEIENKTTIREYNIGGF